MRPRHTLYREYSAGGVGAVREVVPRVERTGLDEGYLDFAGLAADFARARAVAEAVQTSVRAATSLSVLARRRADEGRGQGRLRPAQARRDHRRPGRHRGRASSRRSRSARLPGVGPRAEERLRAAGRDDDRRARRAVRPRPARAAARAGRPDAPRPRERHRPARARADDASGSRSRSRRPSSATCTTARQLHAELRRMAGRLGPRTSSATACRRAR